MDLSKALEDYLITIFTLSQGKGTTGIKEISDALCVKKPSVVIQLKKLKKLGLVKQEKYGKVVLTEIGSKIAKNLYNKNRVIYIFMKEILKIPAEIAKKDACGFEHYMHPDTVNSFIRFIKKQNPEIFEKFKMEEMFELTLNDLKIGEIGIVVAFKGEHDLITRLMEMGIVVGETVKVVREAPLGDPIDILIKGFHLSIRRNEAKTIIVRKVENGKQEKD